MKSSPGTIAPGILGDPLYLQHRLEPQCDDPLYLHLSDLRLALGAEIASRPCSRVLDYGCGGSPYRSLFQSECYHRADIRGTPDVDFILDDSSRITAADADYDCVLSTQVLEHVKDVNIYLQECRRVLRPDGRLLLTTHGTFHEHGCPYDFRRWTADGLHADLAAAGLAVERIEKLTTGPRALVFLNQYFHGGLVASRRSRIGMLLWLCRRVFARQNREQLNRLCDHQYRECRRVPAGTAGHELYIALLAVARPA